jgi:hypothetical protein
MAEAKFILQYKDINEIMEETLKELEAMGITETDAGGVARLLLYIINKRLATYYETLNINQMQAFVSHATGFFLDKIGRLLDCDRRPEEIGNDDAYRYRITKQIQVVASANRMAVRLAALSVSGVQDVKMKPFTHGTGSFSIYVISEDVFTPESILEEVRQKMDEFASFGIRAEVFRPYLVPVELRTRLLFKKNVSDLDKKLIISQANEAIRQYMNSRNAGDPFSFDTLTSNIQSLHEDISDIIYFDFKVNNRPAFIKDQTCAWNERFVQSDKPNAVQVI